MAAKAVGAFTAVVIVLSGLLATREWAANSCPA